MKHAVLNIQSKYFRVKTACLFLLLTSSFISFSQEKKKVEILDAEILTANEKIASNAQRLVGHVYLKHNDILIWCDSAYTYTGTNRVDAFGNVHINKNDTLQLYANKVFYDGDKKFAQAIKNVKLENKTTTLYSDTVDYDLEANIGYYDDYGKIIDSTTTLTSRVGKYFIDEDIIHFMDDVNGYDEDYTLESEDIRYNTETKIFYIDGPTTIRDSANTLYAEDGWYNTETGEMELTQKPEIYNELQFLKANYIKYNEETGNGQALGKVHINDYENSAIIEGEKVFYNDENETAVVADSAVLMLYDQQDTLFLHADTLRTVPDTVEGEKLIKAFYKVKFYRTDIQGICDSLVYFTKDSVVQLYYNPVIWSDIHQMSADQIELKQVLNAADEMRLINNSFIISKQDSGRFDQIKGKNMIGYIVENELNNINVDGNGQTLYYAREENQLIGVNRAESSKIKISFKNGAIHRIVFLKAPNGTLKPMFELNAEDKRLDGFDWKITLRPLTKHDIFTPVMIEKKAAAEEPEKQ